MSEPTFLQPDCAIGAEIAILRRKIPFCFRLDTLRPAARRPFRPFPLGLRTHRAERNAAGIPQLPPCTGHDHRRGQRDEGPADRGHGLDHERRRHAAGHHLQGGFLPHARRLQVRPHLPAIRSIWRSPTSGTSPIRCGSPRPSSGAASRSKWRSTSSRSPRSWSWASRSPWSLRATPRSTTPGRSKRWPTTVSKSS